ncbi:hypothetical protein SUGI_0523330 [Cryptomeria japonica]|nr:hypothetical protein SUGI_0523330 [Cryptomeria japonica]
MVFVSILLVIGESKFMALQLFRGMFNEEFLGGLNLVVGNIDENLMVPYPVDYYAQSGPRDVAVTTMWWQNALFSLCMMQVFSRKGSPLLQEILISYRNGLEEGRFVEPKRSAMETKRGPRLAIETTGTFSSLERQTLFHMVNASFWTRAYLGRRKRVDGNDPIQFQRQICFGYAWILGSLPYFR